jgi:hypothetical protein
MVRLAVYDVAGRLIATLHDGYRPEDAFVAEWNGQHKHGEPAGSGVYFYRLEAPGFTASRKMVLMK